MSKLRVLVAEDENLVALDICRSLERHGYEVAGPCSTAESAVKLTQELRPDAVVMDIMLKGQNDGIHAAAQIRDTTGIPVLFLTAHADKQTVTRARLVEPHGYLVKPFDDAQLYAALEMILYKCQLTDANAEMKKIPVGVARSQQGVDVSKSLSSSNPGTIVEKEEVLRSHEFFSGVDKYELARFAELCSFCTLRPGEILRRGGDDEQGTPSFLVQAGRMAMIEPSTDGKELIIEFVPPGDLFGLIGAVERRATPLLARAARETRLLLIPRKSFMLFLEAHSQLAVQFSEYVSNRFRTLQGLARAIAYDDVFSRVALTLGALLPRFGKTDAQRKSFSLDFSRQELASLTGTTVETVVRVLKSMERAGVVRLGQRNRIEIIDIDALINSVGEKPGEDKGKSVDDMA